MCAVCGYVTCGLTIANSKGFSVLRKVTNCIMRYTRSVIIRLLKKECIVKRYDIRIERLQSINGEELFYKLHVDLHHIRNCTI